MLNKLNKKKNTILFFIGLCSLSIIADNGPSHRDPLVLAAESGDQERVDLHLKSGKEAGVNRDIINQAFLAAAKNGHSGVVKSLLESGAIPNVSDADDMTALMIAAKEGHLNVLQALLQNKVETELVNRDGETALLIAIRKGNFDMVNELIQAGSDINYVSATGVTPLIIAAKKGYEAIVKLLCESGAAKPDARVMASLPDMAREMISQHCTLTGYLKSQWGSWKSFLGEHFTSKTQQEDSSYEPTFSDPPSDDPLSDDEATDIPELVLSRGEMLGYLAVLGLSESDFNRASIRKAYRQLALQHHPDKGGSAEVFKEVNEAYEQLIKNFPPE